MAWYDDMSHHIMITGDNRGWCSPAHDMMISWYDIYHNDILITGDNRGWCSPAQQETRSLRAVSCSLKGPQGSPSSSKFIISIIALNQCNIVATDDCDKNKKFPVWFSDYNVACRNTKHFISIIFIIIIIMITIMILNMMIRLRSTAKTSVLGLWSRRRWWRMTSSRTFHRARSEGWWGWRWCWSWSC